VALSALRVAPLRVAAESTPPREAALRFAALHWTEPFGPA
jgi:hypothetical protein